MEMERSLSAGHRGEWRQPDPRDSRQPMIPHAERGVPVVGGGMETRSGALDARYRAMEHARHGSGVVVSEPVKASSRDWRGDPNADIQARQRDAMDSRSRDRGRGMDSKSAGHVYDARDRGVPPRESAAAHGAWGGEAMHPAPMPARGMMDDRSRGAAIPREAPHPSWGVGGASLPVPYPAAGGPDRRHSGGADARYDPYKAAPPRAAGGLRRY